MDKAARENAREQRRYLRSRCEAATPSPWKYVPQHIAESNSQVRAPEGWLLCELPSDDDAWLIASCRNALPALLQDADDAENEFGALASDNARLQARVSELEAALANERGFSEALGRAGLKLAFRDPAPPVGDR